jgi:2'-5' RNA ligase
MRIFLAVELPDEIRRGLMAEQVRLGKLLRGVRWARPETLHLTLLFLGEISGETVPELEARGGAACSEVPRGSARVAGHGCYPTRGRARVLWAGVRDDAAATLGGLHGALTGVARDLGLAVEERPFSPHLTLGRAREPLARRRVEEAFAVGGGLDLGELPVTECVLFRSHLGPGGARHEPLARLVLGSREPGS